MDVLHVIRPGIVMNLFFHQSNQLRNLKIFTLVLIQIVLLLISGCQNPNPKSYTPSSFGQKSDITEDLYHRLKAGLFRVETDAVIAHIVKKGNLYSKLRLPFYSKSAPHKMVRVSWERGSFWVKSDDQALVVIYMDTEAAFSHVHLFTLEGFGNIREFRESTERPIR